MSARGVRAAAGRVRRRRGGIVLLYHRVAELASDPQLLAVTPARFAEQMAVLRRAGRRVALSEMAARVASGRSVDGDVAVTFDDGYADNLHQALPILERHGVPATFFVVSGAIDDGAEFWWDEVERLILQPRATRAEAGGTDVARDRGATATADDPHWNVCDAGTRSARQELYVSLCERIRPLDAVRRGAALAMLRAWTRQPATGRPTHRALNRGELRRLAASRYATIGAHSATHPVLARLGAAAQHDEVARAKGLLERVVGRPVNLFSYPYGTRGTFDATSVACLRKTGFAAACANQPGLVSRTTDVLALPRFIVRDWGGDEFERRLDAWWDGPERGG